MIECVLWAVGSRRATNGRATAVVVCGRDGLGLRRVCGGLPLTGGVVLDLVLLVERACCIMRCALEPFTALECALLEPLARNVADAWQLERRLHACVHLQDLTLLKQLSVAFQKDLGAILAAKQGADLETLAGD